MAVSVFAEMLYDLDPVLTSFSKAAALEGLLAPGRDYRLWDDWGWIEHSIEAHQALKYFETPRPHKMIIRWSEEPALGGHSTHVHFFRRQKRWWRRGS